MKDEPLLVAPHHFLFEVLRLLLEPADEGEAVFTVLFRQAIDLEWAVRLPHF